MSVAIRERESARRYVDVGPAMDEASLARSAKAATTRRRNKAPLLAAAGLIEPVTADDVAARRQAYSEAYSRQSAQSDSELRMAIAIDLRLLRRIGVPNSRIRSWLADERAVTGRYSLVYLADYLWQRLFEAGGRYAARGALALRGISWTAESLPNPNSCRLCRDYAARKATR